VEGYRLEAGSRNNVSEQQAENMRKSWGEKNLIEERGVRGPREVKRVDVDGRPTQIPIRVKGRIKTEKRNRKHRNPRGRLQLPSGNAELECDRLIGRSRGEERGVSARKGAKRGRLVGEGQEEGGYYYMRTRGGGGG